MENINITFSPSLDIKSIPLDKYDKDFTFIVNEKQYKTSRFIADLISPTISKNHFNDGTINKFTLKIPVGIEKSEAKSERDYFQEFLNLYQHENIEIDTIAREYYCDYFLQLGNYNEYLKLHPEYFKDLSSDNIFDRFNTLSNNVNSSSSQKDYGKKVMHNIVDSEVFSQMLNYFSSHFDEIDKEQLKELGKDAIEKIIRSDSLILEEEDSLLKFIIELYQKDQEYSNLFEYVYFVNVKEETLEEFINCFSLDYINSGIWKKICQRLLQKKDDQFIENRYFEKVTEITYIRGKELQGILNHLNTESGGNIHDNETITISTNNSFNDSDHPKNLVDYNESNYFRASNAYVNVLFDFKERKIQLDAYSIKSSDNRTNYYHLKGWVIEGSNDKQNWERIDERRNISNLNGSGFIDTFTVKPNDQFYRFIRLVEVENNCNCSYDNTIISCLEFYGKLKETINQKK